ncbi:ABC-three component system protein [Methanococcus maripaludis]|uniref:HNH endonuclease n=1 Tax=Methanococcus maripaludis TaxID=39152 RepID=A0A8T4CK46_METMI|nr:ABC-three component system protein [Methanococcus maripaludis]MBM7408764.1 hypothetical protein [Methanococcus maripaludis]MBP2219067.1 hypothetical protein [Methanococcus maripaludis]
MVVKEGVNTNSDKKKNNRHTSEKTVKVLWGRSGSMCAMCNIGLSPEEGGNSYHIGEHAHIMGLNNGSARYDPSMTDDERNDVGNLILLCANCHKKIDKNALFYTPEKLKKIKEEHEKWVKRRLQISDFSFDELGTIVKYIHRTNNSLSTPDLKSIAISDKIAKNNLSDDINYSITIGLLKHNVVEKYLKKNIDPEFNTIIIANFSEKYQELKEKGYSDDSLFYELWNYSSGNSPEPSIRLAGLTLLTYLFELCEVFEK